MVLDWTWRWIPGHIWVRLVVTPRLETEPSHEWIYHGLVHRDAWRFGPIGFTVLRMPCFGVQSTCPQQRRYSRIEARNIRRVSRRRSR